MKQIYLDYLLAFCFIFLVTTLSAQIEIFSDNFNTLNFKEEWSWETVEGADGLVGIQFDAGPDNSGAVRIGKSVDGDLTIVALDLQVDLSDPNFENVDLSFDILDRTDETNPGLEGIFLSDDNGLTFVSVLQFDADSWCNGFFGKYPSIDIDKLAVDAGLNWKSNNFIIRFQQAGVSDFSGSVQDGFILDNVMLIDPQTSFYPVSPDNELYEDFNSGSFSNNMKSNFPYESLPLSLHTIDFRNSLIQIANEVGTNNSQGLLLGNICETDELSCASIDIFLNNSSEELDNLALTFQIRDLNDENNPGLEGIYISDDGGVTFEQMPDFSFMPESWCSSFSSFPLLRIDQMAEKIGINWRSAEFVIRFQQIGTSDFSGTQTDGFIIDDIRVFDPEINYQTEDFAEDFENGFLNAHMKRNFSDESLVNTSEYINYRDGSITIEENIGVSGSNGLVIGKICDGDPTVNSLDWYVNLENFEQINLNFSLRDLQEANDNDDGVFFSNDGGETFDKIYDFNLDTIANVFNDYSIDISNFLLENNLSASSNCVIRFQQRGVEDLVGLSTNGIILDNLMLTTIVNINTIGTADFNIFPNPTSNLCKIQTEQPGILKVYNSTGKQILHFEEIPSEINMIDLSRGLYIFQFETDQHIITKKVIKN